MTVASVLRCWSVRGESTLTWWLKGGEMGGFGGGSLEHPRQWLGA